MTGVFISHAAADSDFVGTFVDTVMRLGCGVPPESIFYSSGADTSVPAGVDLNAYVRERVSDNVLVVAIITPTFQTRPYCIAELGAAWSRAGSLLPLAVPGMAHSDFDGVLKGMMVKYLNDAAALDQLHDQVGKLIDRSTGATTWGRYRDRWLRDVDSHVNTLSGVRSSEVVSVTSCSREAGHMELFWTDKSSSVSYRWWLAEQGWSDVHQMQNVKADYVAAVSPDGEELLFGIHGTGQVWMRPWKQNDQGSMVAGDLEWIPGEVVGPLTALNRGWEVELTAWTPEKEQCHLWREGNGWTDWTTEWHKKP